MNGPVAAVAAAGVYTLPVAGSREVAAGTRWLWFEPPEGAGPAALQPGHFFMLSPVEPGAVFLGRPFSIGDVRDGRWGFLIRMLGRGTAWLAGLAEGARVRAVGPLGLPFRLADQPVHRLVAGGVGLAPFYYLARRLRAERSGARIELHYGERAAASHADFDAGERELFDVVARWTDDGGRGSAGTVVQGLDGSWSDPEVAWYGCGPPAMLRALAAKLEEHGVAGAQFSMEERMACGFGVCQACIVERRDPPPRYRLLCTEGPVVDPRTVAW